MSTPITSHGLNGILWCVSFSLGCVCWNSRHVAHNFIYASILALTLCQNTDSWASSFIFSMSMWFMCSCMNTCCFKLSGMIMCLPFSHTPSITASSSLYGQYGLMLVCSSSLVCAQPAIINVFSCWRWTSCIDAYCIYSIDMQSGMFTKLWMASTHMSISFMGLSLPST